MNYLVNFREVTQCYHQSKMYFFLNNLPIILLPYTIMKNSNGLGIYQLLLNKYRVLRSYNGDPLNQRVQGGNDRTEGMARKSGINQMGPQQLKFQVS